MIHTRLLSPLYTLSGVFLSVYSTAMILLSTSNLSYGIIVATTSGFIILTFLGYSHKATTKGSISLGLSGSILAAEVIILATYFNNWIATTYAVIMLAAALLAAKGIHEARESRFALREEMHRFIRR